MEAPQDPKRTERPARPEPMDSEALLELALRHLDEPSESDWLRRNPLAARGYITGVWIAFAEMSSDPNPNPIPFVLCQHPALAGDWFQQTPVGKAWHAITDDRADKAASGEALHELRRILEQRVEMIQYVQRLLADLTSDLDARKDLLKRLHEARHDLEEFQKSNKTAPDKQEIAKMEDLERKLREMNDKERSLWRFLSRIARMDADHMFPTERL